VKVKEKPTEIIVSKATTESMRTSPDEGSDAGDLYNVKKEAGVMGDQLRHSK
jgi:hypothetical protein